MLFYMLPDITVTVIRALWIMDPYSDMYSR